MPIEIGSDNDSVSGEYVTWARWTYQDLLRTESARIFIHEIIEKIKEEISKQLSVKVIEEVLKDEELVEELKKAVKEDIWKKVDEMSLDIIGKV